ncbi:MAG: zinc ribbon domain-containing protein [Anaerolineae bacterium]|nr:zinc ribbon domain-containing protein [Anaerolineae bacterium]
MPTYNYKCTICGADFVERHSFDTSPKKITCPNGHLQTQRVYSAPAVVFKGGGFYVNDNRTGTKNGSSGK